MKIQIMPIFKEESEIINIQLTTLQKIIQKQSSLLKSELEIINWASPIPYFGDPSKSTIATVGLNPSNIEFVDSGGVELSGDKRRFQTLGSLNISDWTAVNSEHLYKIYFSCTEYFYNNPYDGWFKSLDRLLHNTGFSFYSSLFPACHLDLIPYATAKKWSQLSQRQKKKLLEASRTFLGETIRNSPIETIVLNGKTVVEAFSNMTDIKLRSYPKEQWNLPRKVVKDVPGIAYEGELSIISGVSIGRKVKVLGFNHNLQSSFGVTTKVRTEIQSWLTKSTEIK